MDIIDKLYSEYQAQPSDFRFGVLPRAHEYFAYAMQTVIIALGNWGKHTANCVKQEYLSSKTFSKTSNFAVIKYHL